MSPSNEKFRTTIWVSRQIWDEAGKKLPSRSEFIENQLRLAAGLKDEEKELIDKIDIKKKELHVLRDRLCSVQKLKEKSKNKDKKNLSNLDSAVEVCVNMNTRQGLIGENQINDVSIFKEVEFDILLQACVENCLKIVKNYGGLKTTKDPTGTFSGRYKE